MALKEFEFGFGKTTQKVSLPEEHILDILEGAPTPACDVEAATLECMRHPIGSKPLTEDVSKGDKVCIVCADVTMILSSSRRAPTANRPRKKISLSLAKS